MHTIAVEDMVTAVCETFVEMLEELGYDPSDVNQPSPGSVEQWYLRSKTDEERRHISERILEELWPDKTAEKESKGVSQ